MVQLIAAKKNFMNDFHKIWIDQCEAAEGIREQFGVQDAARYLIGEKLLRFMDASHDHAEFAKELPDFINRIRLIFEPHDILACFEDLEAGRVFDPAQAFNGRDPEEVGPDEHDVLRDAEKILLIENAKRLLLPQ